MTAAICPSRIAWLAGHVLPHEPALRQWLAGRGPGALSACEIDDIVQDTYAALVSLAAVDHIDAPRAYLFTTARSILLQQLRRAKVVQIEAVADIERLRVEDQHTPERHMSAHQELRRLHALLAALPGKCREAFVLRRVEGLTQREIAARMGISENTVEKHVGKALRLLTDAMGRGDSPGADSFMEQVDDIDGRRNVR
ncbi:sigma-70 family RNA polymerase sigma factor [Luteimonas sp. XNQY3]|nr:sigma-70 family RNA polymerase sigma factor [Luteimonas sp. XNQY3]MCD9004769.1 sigma-70 family RNA polymerase sigma factor [Luteimonas sp. XNQY3]